MQVQYCCKPNCFRLAEWRRSTQFSGVHPFCDQDAREEEDFASNSGDSIWNKIKTPTWAPKELSFDCVKPGVYRHYTNRICHVIGISENAETHGLSVVYSYQEGGYAGKLLSCSILKFFEPLAISRHSEHYPDHKGPRFILIEEKKFL